MMGKCTKRYPNKTVRVKDHSKNGASKIAERGWGGKEGFPFPFPSPLFHFLVLVSFLARSKPKIPIHGLFYSETKVKRLLEGLNGVVAFTVIG